MLSPESNPLEDDNWQYVTTDRNAVLETLQIDANQLRLYSVLARRQELREAYDAERRAALRELCRAIVNIPYEDYLVVTLPTEPEDILWSWTKAHYPACQPPQRVENAMEYLIRGYYIRDARVLDSTKRQIAIDIVNPEDDTELHALSVDLGQVTLGFANQNEIV